MSLIYMLIPGEGVRRPGSEGSIGSPPGWGGGDWACQAFFNAIPHTMLALASGGDGLSSLGLMRKYYGHKKLLTAD